jgi:hypothetical protein
MHKHAEGMLGDRGCCFSLHLMQGYDTTSIYVMLLVKSLRLPEQTGMPSASQALAKLLLVSHVRSLNHN